MTPLSTVKQAVKRTFASRWGWRALAPLVRKPGVIVLTYHRITPGRARGPVGLPVEIFAEQMRWVRATCDPIGPESLVARAQRPSRLRPAVLVTFDDGYRDYHDLAYPILKALDIPAVVFLATSFVDEGGMLWTDQVRLAVENTRKERVTLPWSNEAIALGDAAARDTVGTRAREHLKQLPDGERRAAVQALLAELGDPPARERQMLSWDEVRATMPLTRYGGHTHTHPILSRLDDAAADREIATCKARIAAETGVAPTTFAYPNGRPSDFTDATKQILRRHGFALAFATSDGIAGADSDWLAIKRLSAESATTLPELAWIAAGLMR